MKRSMASKGIRVMQSAVRACVAAVVIGSGVTAARANPAPESFLNLDIGTNGQIFAVARDSQGRTLIGGTFREVDDLPRSNLARLNADGSLDTSFNLGANNTVTALVVASDDTIYVGGGFGNIGGVSRLRLARIGANGVVSTTFPANAPNGTLRALQLDEANGFLYYGGSFMAPRTRLAKVSTATSALDGNFNFNIPSGTVQSLALDGAGGLFVGGTFPSISAQAQPVLARVFVDGTSGTNGVDLAFAPVLSLPAGGNVYALAVNATHVFAGGFFNAAIAHMAKIDRSTGVIDTSWNPAPNTSVRSISLGANDSLLLAGNFTSLGATPSTRLARVSQLGSAAIDAGWTPTVNRTVNAMAVSGNKLVLGGNFTDVGGALRPALAELPLDAAPVPTQSMDAFVATPGGATNSLLHADGSLWIGGTFLKINGHARQRLARILADGTLDASFDLPLNGDVYKIDSDASGRVYVMGQFSAAGGIARDSLLRLTTNRLLDPTFLAGVRTAGNLGTIYDAVISDDAVYVAGFIDTAGDVGAPGSARAGIAKFNLGDGVLAAGWAPLAVSDGSQIPVQALALDTGNDRLYLGGGFQTVNGEAHMRLARVQASTGTLDAAFTPSVDGTGDVWSLAYDPIAQHLYVGGLFDSINATSGFESFARINTVTGALDTSFDAGLMPGDQVEDFLFDTPQTICIAGIGSFAQIARYYRVGMSPRDTSFAPEPDNYVIDLQYRASDRTLFAAGQFGAAGGELRDGLAAFKLVETLFGDGFE